MAESQLLMSIQQRCKANEGKRCRGCLGKLHRLFLDELAAPVGEFRGRCLERVCLGIEYPYKAGQWIRHVVQRVDYAH